MCNMRLSARWRAILIIFAILFLPYSSWCVGLWGLDTTQWQGVFECLCPGFTASVRYRPFKMLSSGCNTPTIVSISPNGRYVVITEASPPRIIAWDFVTNNKREFNYQHGDRAFITDTLYVIGWEDRAVLIDVSDGSQIELPVSQFVPNQPMPPAVLDTLAQAKYIVKIESIYGTPQIVALASDYKLPGARNTFVFSLSSQEILEALKSANIRYETPARNGQQQEEINSSQWVDFNPLPVVRSRSGNFLAGQEGIYAANTLDVLLQTGYVPSPTARDFEVALQVHGWTLDDHSVVYSRFSLGSELWGTRTGQPILLLELPSQYWSMPIVTPVP